MKLITLNEQCVISGARIDDYHDEPSRTEFATLKINPQYIESMYWAGLTYITMQSGAKFKVREDLEEIEAMIQEVGK